MVGVLPLARLTMFIISPGAGRAGRGTRLPAVRAKPLARGSTGRCAIFLPRRTLICYVGTDSTAQRLSKMTAKLDVQTRDGVLLLTIDNPAQRNALAPDFSRAAAEALRRAATDPGVRA